MIADGWLHKDTESRISRLMVTCKDAEKRLVRWYSLVRLDFRSGLVTWIVGYLWYGVLWRWLWYVRRERCTAFQMGVIAASKKKIQQRSEIFALSTILMIGAMDTMMTTARHEAGPAGPPMVPVTP